MNRRVWAMSFAVAFLLGCGDDGGGGGGGESGGICEEDSSAFDEAACEACWDAADDCLAGRHCRAERDAGTACVMRNCGTEYAAADRCEDEAFDRCWDAHADDMAALDACFDAACVNEEAAAEACARANCISLGYEWLACVHNQCPGSSACVSLF